MLKPLIDINQQQVITLIGSGGKTTTMYYLAALAVAAGLRVLVTTTTKIFYLPEDAERFIQASIYSEWEGNLIDRASRNDFIVTGSAVQKGKILGVSPDWIDRLSQRGMFDLILVEGDGSARKPVKAPCEGEPVVPASTTLLLPVIGLRAIYEPLGEDIVHREEIFKELTGLCDGELIRPTDIYQVFLHPKGYHLADYLPGMQVIPILNQADDLYREEIGLELADLFLQSGVTQVVLTSHNDVQVKWRVYS